MIKEIVANIKSDDLEILFRMDSGYFDEKNYRNDRISWMQIFN